MKRIYKMINGECVDITEEATRIPESLSAAIWGEIQPYEFMGESHRGKFEVVQSRTRHREVLKEGGYIEVGNEKPKNLPKRGNINV